MTLRNWRMDLAAKIVQITKKEGYVTVEISAYKPIFVTGAVKHPGAIEWRPGMTVIQAIALAGGLGAQLGTAGEADAGGPSQALEKDIDNEKRVLATIARLTAERDGSPQITIPQRLVKLVGDAEADRLISHEEEILKTTRDVLASKLAILERGINDSESEISALREQSAKITEQLQLQRDYIRRLGSSRPDEEQMKLSDLEEKARKHRREHREELRIRHGNAVFCSWAEEGSGVCVFQVGTGQA